MGQPVVHFEVIGKDGRAATDYYSKLFGWKFNYDNQRNFGFIQLDGTVSADRVGITGGVGEAREGTPSYATFYVGVPDVEAALAKAEHLGGKRVMGPMTVAEGVEIGQFRDPDGNLIGLAKAT